VHIYTDVDSTTVLCFQLDSSSCIDRFRDVEGMRHGGVTPCAVVTPSQATRINNMVRGSNYRGACNIPLEESEKREIKVSCGLTILKRSLIMLGLSWSLLDIGLKLTRAELMF